MTTVPEGPVIFWFVKLNRFHLIFCFCFDCISSRAQITGSFPLQGNCFLGTKGRLQLQHDGGSSMGNRAGVRGRRADVFIPGFRHSSSSSSSFWPMAFQQTVVMARLLGSLLPMCKSQSEICTRSVSGIRGSSRCKLSLWPCPSASEQGR